MKTFPVVEQFGPTIEGEGPRAGMPCCFIRFGGCDYNCSWCDSLFAVLPSEVRKAERLTVAEIMERVPVAPHAVLSGGNPALHELGPLVEALHERRMTVSVETQGSRWKDWLAGVDHLVVSPKPPSSGMATEEHHLETEAFMTEAEWAADRLGGVRPAVKIVVFDETDYKWAQGFHVKYSRLPFFLSVGTPESGVAIKTPEEDRAVISEVLDGYKRLCEWVANDPQMADVRVLPQLHVLAFGTVRGV